MKQSQNSGMMHQNQSSRAMPENKDNLDSRHREEEMVKGDDLTNNRKEHHSLNKQKQ